MKKIQIYLFITSLIIPIHMVFSQVENQLNDSLIEKNKTDFNLLLDNQFKSAKDDKPKLDWFEGTWSRYRPQKGKDKRGKTGVDENTLISISNKINSLEDQLKVHKTIKKIFSFEKLN